MYFTETCIYVLQAYGTQKKTVEGESVIFLLEIYSELTWIKYLSNFRRSMEGMKHREI